MRRRLVSIFVFVIVALALLYVGANIFISRMLALPVVRREVVRRTKKRFGRALEMGSLRLSLTGALCAEEIVINDREGFDTQPFFEARRVYARLKVLPLLRKKVVISTLEFETPILVLERAESGELNIQDMLGGGRSAAPDVDRADLVLRPSETLPDIPLSVDIAQRAFVVKSISLQHATVRLIDRHLKRYEELPDVHIRLRANMSDGVINIPQLVFEMPPARFTVVGKVSRQLDEADLQLTAESFNLMSMRDRISALRHFTGGRLQVSDLKARLKLSQRVVSIRNLSCAASGGVFGGEFTVDISEQTWPFSAQLEAKDIELDPFLWNTRDDGLSFGGTLAMAGVAKGNGFRDEELDAFLEGDGSFTIQDGRFQNPVFAAIDDIIASFIGRRLLEDFRGDASGSFVIEKGQGRVATDDLVFVSKSVSIFTASDGYVTLHGELDFGDTVVKIGDQQIPIRIKGTIYDPTVIPDLRSFGRKWLRQFWK